MHRILILLTLILCVSCSNSSKVETEIVKASTLHLENIKASTPILQLMKGVPYSRNYDYNDRFKSIYVKDSRILRYHNIPVKSVEISLQDGYATVIEIKFIDNAENAKIKDEEEKKTNRDGLKIKSILDKQIRESEQRYDDRHEYQWKQKSTEYTMDLTENYYRGNRLSIEFNNQDETANTFY